MKRLLGFLLALLLVAPVAAQSPQVKQLLLRQMPAVVSGNDPATTAWVAAVVSAGGTVSGGRTTVVNTFITCLKTASLWTTLDRYWLLAGENAGSAQVDMVNLQSLTVVNAPTFTANQGYTGASTKYLDSNYNPNGSTNYTQNSATAGVFINTSSAASGYAFGAANGAFNQITTWNPSAFGAALPETRLNTSGSSATGTSTASTRGAALISRNGSSTSAPVYYNGSSFDTMTSTTTGLPGSNFYIGAVSQGGSPAAYSTFQVSDFVAASGWSSGQVSSFYSCQSALLTSVGVLP